MCIFICVYIYIICIYLCIYIYTCVCVSICIYIYILLYSLGELLRMNRNFAPSAMACRSLCGKNIAARGLERRAELNGSQGHLSAWWPRMFALSILGIDVKNLRDIPWTDIPNCAFVIACHSKCLRNPVPIIIVLVISRYIRVMNAYDPAATMTCSK